MATRNRNTDFRVNLVRGNSEKEKRFWSKIDVPSHADGSRNHDACWNWEGTLTQYGYGIAHAGVVEGKAKSIRAHILSFALSNPTENVEKGFVLHRCNNRRCCNPTHLYLGDHRQNMADAREANQSRLTNHPRKLTEKEVVAIRELYATGEFPQWRLADRFGVSQYTICCVVRGELWKGAGGQITVKAIHKPHTNKATKLTMKQREEMERLYADGITVSELAERYGVSTSYATKVATNERKLDNANKHYVGKRKRERNVGNDKNSGRK